MARSIVIDVLARDGASATLSRVGATAELTAARYARAGERMIATGRRMTHTLTLPILALGAASVKAATDYNAAITRIGTQAGATGRDVAYLNTRILALSKYAQQGPTDLANAAYHLKSVGLSAVQTMRALKQGSDLAAVSGADLEETVNALAGAWRTGIRGAKNFHEAVATVNAIIGAGNMRVGDLNAALGTGILASAKTFGLTFKDVGAAVAVFTDEGMQADAAATRLRMSFSLLGAPSKAAEKQLKKIHLTGLELAQDMRRPNGLIVAIGDLKDHLDRSGLSAAKQSILLSHAFGGGRSSAAILSLVNNYDVLQQKQAQVTRSMGKFNAAVKAQRATPEAQFKLLESSLQRSAVIIGNKLLPNVITLVHDVGSIAEKFNHLSPGMRRIIIDGALAAAVLGPVLAIGGRLVKVFGLLWRAGAASSRFVAGQRAAQTSLEATSAAAGGAASTVSMATLKMNASQLSQQSAVARSAASIALSESEKANAAVRAAESMANSARAAGGAESVLAERAATDARIFAAAKAVEAEAAVKAAATITVASMQATRALGRQTAVAGGGRGMLARGAGMSLAIGAMFAGPAIAGNSPRGSARNRAGTGVSDAGMGALIGSFIPIPGATVAGAVVGGGYGSMQIGDPKNFKVFLKNVKDYQRQEKLVAVATKNAAIETRALNAATDKYGRLTAKTRNGIVASALAYSGLTKVAQRFKVSSTELTTAVTGTNSQYSRLRTMMGNLGASDQFLTSLDKIRGAFLKGGGSAALMQKEVQRLKRRMDAIKTGMDLGTLNMSDAAAKAQIAQLSTMVANLQGQINGLNGTTISFNVPQSLQSANLADLLQQLQTGQITQAQYDKAYHGAGGLNTGGISVKVHGGSGGGAGGGGGSGSGGGGGGSGSGPSAAISAALAKAKQLAALRVKIRTSDLTALKRAMRGTVDDTRAAFTTMFADMRAVGAGQIDTVLRAGERRLLALQNKISNARTYQSGIKSTLAGAFDPTMYGSVQDLLQGFSGATSKNKSYTNEVNKLRREAKGNKTLLAFINQLAASGQTATLQTLAGASKGQLVQVAKAVGGYNESLAKGSQAAELAKFGDSVNKMVHRQDHLTSAIAMLARAVVAHPIELDGEKITKHVLNDTQFIALLDHLADLAKNGRRP